MGGTGDGGPVSGEVRHFVLGCGGFDIYSDVGVSLNLNVTCDLDMNWNMNAQFHDIAY